MFKLLSNCLKTTPLVVASVLLVNSVATQEAQANEPVDNTDSMLQEVNNYSSDTNSMSQVTSVSQLRDVSPTDWAYEALRSLVERYGCIVGYPDRTFRGNRATSRYEFAAGLNACMQQMERLIAQSEAVLREDIEKLKRLMQEFEAELAALGARVDNLEGRVAFLEDHQFSTTTKLKGEVIISAQAYAAPDYKLDDYYDLGGRSPIPDNLRDQARAEFNVFSSNIIPGIGDNFADIRPDYERFLRGEITQEEFEEIVSDTFAGSIQNIDESDDEATLSNRVRLAFDTSFTGKDRLRTRLQARNTPDLGDAFGANQARLNYDGDDGNDVILDRLWYRTPVGDSGTFWVGTALPVEDIYETFSPYTESSATGSLARVNRFNPFIYRTPGDAGIGFKYEFNKTFNVTASYLAGDANNPQSGGGLFDGEYATGIQLGINPSENFGIGIAYMHTYFPGDRDGVDVRRRANLDGSTGSNYSSGISNSLSLLGLDGGFRGSRDPFSGAATTSDNVGIQASWRITEGINWAAWGGWLTATGQSHDSTGVDRRGDNTELWTWNTNFSFLDLGKDGAVLTIAGGQLPRAGDVDGTIGRDRGQAWIVEGNYQYPVNDNISLTPGVYAVFNPNNSSGSGNDTIVVGVLRTVFKF